MIRDAKLITMFEFRYLLTHPFIICSKISYLETINANRKCILVKSTTPPCIVFFYQREKIRSLRDTSLTTNWKYVHFTAPRKA